MLILCLQVPEDLAMILNDSTLFSNSADITTKEILRRYGDRAKAPQVTSANASQIHNGTSSPTPVVTRVETDSHVQNAWQNESSVRHVGSDLDRRTGAGEFESPQLPYANPRDSSESHGSPNRGNGNANGVRAGGYDKQRVMGVA